MLHTTINEKLRFICVLVIIFSFKDLSKIKIKKEKKSGINKNLPKYKAAITIGNIKIGNIVTCYIDLRLEPFLLYQKDQYQFLQSLPL